ncbi:hypothetical protein Tco_0541429 [Tanacetum coccineum]
MRTRSSSNLIVVSSTIPKRHNRRTSPRKLSNPSLNYCRGLSVGIYADTRTMLEYSKHPEGYRDAIVIPAILAENFKLKVGLLQLVTSSQFMVSRGTIPILIFVGLTRSLLRLTAGGNLLNRTPRDALTIIENKSKVRTSRNKPVVSKNKTPSPAPVKAIEETCVTCGGLHPYYECLATNGNTFNASAATGTYNQGGPGYRP